MSEKIYLKIGLVLLNLVIISAFSLNVSAQKKSKTASLCQADEQTIWTCMTVKNKLASICASDPISEDKGYVQYRYGVLGKVELEFPKVRKDSRKEFKYSRYTRPLVTMLTLSFENEGVFYEIHDDDNSEEKPPLRAASIDIKNGEKESSIECKQPVKGSFMILENYFLRDEEN